MSTIPVHPGTKTGLDFYRRRQTLDSLERERPKNIETVRMILTEAIDQVELRLSEIENYFYRGQSCEDDILSLAPSVRQMLNQYQLQFVHSSSHVANLIKLCCSDRQPFTDPSSIDALRDYDMKIRDSLPDDFTNLIETIKKIVIYLNKYCRSFYSNTSGSEEDAYDKSVSQATATYMETPFHYNLQRSEFAAAILNHLENIPRLANMYRTQKVIPAKMFGMNVNELARRTDCDALSRSTSCISIPRSPTNPPVYLLINTKSDVLRELLVFLLFPEACQNIHQSCFGVRKWITTDCQYNGFVKADLDAVEHKRDAQHREVIHLIKKTSTLERRIHNTTREYKDLKQAVSQIHDREMAVDDALETINQEIDIKLDDINSKEQERKAIPKPRNDVEAEQKEYQRQFGVITAEIAQLRMSINPLEHEKGIIMSKKQRITDRKDCASARRAVVMEMKKQLNVNKRELTEAQEKLILLEESYSRLKEIHIYRTAPGVTKKLFLDKPITLKYAKKHLHSKQEKRAAKDSQSHIDVLEVCILASAHEIKNDTDWQSVYRNINFLPPRGLDALEQDIQDVLTKNSTRAPQDRALDILLRWRRCHSQPTLEDLKEVFTLLNRIDILSAMRRAISDAEERYRQRQKAKSEERSKERSGEDAIEWQASRETQLAAKRYMEKCGMMGRRAVKLPAIVSDG